MRVHDSTGDRVVATGEIDEIFLELSGHRRTVTWRTSRLERWSAPVR